MPDNTNNNNLIVQTLFQVKEQIGASDAKNDAILRKLDSIEEQTTRTNGRVTSLEGFRTKIKTVMTVIGLILGGIGSAITWVILAHPWH